MRAARVVFEAEDSGFIYLGVIHGGFSVARTWDYQVSALCIFLGIPCPEPYAPHSLPGGRKFLGAECTLLPFSSLITVPLQ